jgi:hypothetical protein
MTAFSAQDFMEQLKKVELQLQSPTALQQDEVNVCDPALKEFLEGLKKISMQTNKPHSRNGNEVDRSDSEAELCDFGNGDTWSFDDSYSEEAPGKEENQDTENITDSIASSTWTQRRTQTRTAFQEVIPRIIDTLSQRQGYKNQFTCDNCPASVSHLLIVQVNSLIISP